MEANNQDWEEIWQQFGNVESQQLGLGIFDELDLSDVNPYFLPDSMPATYSVGLSNPTQQPCDASPLLPSAFPFLSLEVAFESNPVSCEKFLVEHNVNDVSMKTLRSIVREVHKLQIE